MARISPAFISYIVFFSLMISTVHGILCMCTCCNPSMGQQSGCIIDVGTNSDISNCKSSCTSQCPKECPAGVITGTVIGDTINGRTKTLSVCSKNQTEQ